MRCAGVCVCEARCGGGGRRGRRRRGSGDGACIHPHPIRRVAPGVCLSVRPSVGGGGCEARRRRGVKPSLPGGDWAEEVSERGSEAKELWKRRRRRGRGRDPPACVSVCPSGQRSGGGPAAWWEGALRGHLPMEEAEERGVRARRCGRRRARRARGGRGARGAGRGAVAPQEVWSSSGARSFWELWGGRKKLQVERLGLCR